MNWHTGIHFLCFLLSTSPIFTLFAFKAFKQFWTDFRFTQMAHWMSLTLVSSVLAIFELLLFIKSVLILTLSETELNDHWSMIQLISKNAINTNVTFTNIFFKWQREFDKYTCGFNNNMIKLVLFFLDQLQEHFNQITSHGAAKASIINHNNFFSYRRVTGNQRSINIHLTKL